MLLHVAKNPSTHSSRLERWLGAEQVANISDAMSGGERGPRWYGPPIGVSMVPGLVYATPDGDFVGRISGGGFMGLAERVVSDAARRLRRFSRKQVSTANAGFSSLGDLISEAAAGKMRRFQFQKTGPTGVVQVTSSLWRVGASPPVGATPGNAAGGTAFTSASTGAFPFSNPTGGDTQHFTSGYVTGSVAGNTLLLYDLIFGVNKLMNSVATEAVTGVPTRYQSTVTTAADYAAGNFLTIHVGGTSLPATAHNWTICTYTDQDGNAAASLPSLTGNASAIVDRLDHPVGQWFAPLATGDTGVKALTQMQCSASMISGVIWFMIGHPIAWMPVPIANLICPTDGIRGAFQLVRIFDDACLTFLEVCKPATTATSYAGELVSVAG